MDSNQILDGINFRYGKLIHSLMECPASYVQQTEEGGMTNYLEFLFHTDKTVNRSSPALLLYINLCAPVAAYGEVTASHIKDGIGWSRFTAEEMYRVSTPELRLPVQYIRKAYKDITFKR